jgi:hypothetical protein
MKRLATNFVRRPSLALPGSEPSGSGTELTRHQIGKSGDAKAGDAHPVEIPFYRDHFIAPLGKHRCSECAADALAH